MDIFIPNEMTEAQPQKTLATLELFQKGAYGMVGNRPEEITKAKVPFLKKLWGNTQ